MGLSPNAQLTVPRGLKRCMCMLVHPCVHLGEGSLVLHSGGSDAMWVCRPGAFLSIALNPASAGHCALCTVTAVNSCLHLWGKSKAEHSQFGHVANLHPRQIHGPCSALRGVRDVSQGLWICLVDPSVSSASHRSDLGWLGAREKRWTLGPSQDWP